jgi:prevent-host-death family protein
VFVKSVSAREAKYGFGRLIDTARAEPVTVEKHGRAVVVVLAVEEYERLKAIEMEQSVKAPRSGKNK